MLLNDLIFADEMIPKMLEKDEMIADEIDAFTVDILLVFI